MLKRLLRKKPDEAYVATFGIYDAARDVAEFLKELKKVKKVKILVGVYKKRDGQSQKNYNEYLDRLLNIVKKYPQFQWKFSDKTHIKCIGFRKNGKDLGCIIGGRNLTGSNFDDVSFLLPKGRVRPMREHFGKCFAAGRKITKSNLKKAGR